MSITVTFDSGNRAVELPEKEFFRLLREWIGDNGYPHEGIVFKPYDVYAKICDGIMPFEDGALIQPAIRMFWDDSSYQVFELRDRLGTRRWFVTYSGHDELIAIPECCRFDHEDAAIIVTLPEVTLNGDPTGEIREYRFEHYVDRHSQNQDWPGVLTNPVLYVCHKRLANFLDPDTKTAKTNPLTALLHSGRPYRDLGYQIGAQLSAIDNLLRTTLQYVK